MVIEMKMNTHLKIYIIITILLLILISLFSINIYSKKALDNEVKKMFKMDITKEEISVKTKAFGRYGKIEHAIKEYMKDYSTNIKIANEIINDDTIRKILSVENYENDGPKFEKSLSIIDAKLKSFDEIINKLINMTNKNNIMKYIDKYNLPDKYVKIYENYMFGKEYINDLNNNKKIINKIKEEGLNILNTDKEVINLLKNNPDSWIIKDKKISFYSNAIMEQYDNLIKIFNK